MKLRIDFERNATSISNDTAEKIARMIDTLADEDERFLIVSYANATGTAEQNKTISKKHVLSVASSITGNREKPISIQAVHLGPSERFNSETLSHDAIIEIWSLGKNPKQ